MLARQVSPSFHSEDATVYLDSHLPQAAVGRHEHALSRDAEEHGVG